MSGMKQAVLLLVLLAACRGGREQYFNYAMRDQPKSEMATIVMDSSVLKRPTDAVWVSQAGTEQSAFVQDGRLYLPPGRYTFAVRARTKSDSTQEYGDLKREDRSHLRTPLKAEAGRSYRFLRLEGEDEAYGFSDITDG